jgi:predicted metal-dependent hydrolase
VDEAWQAAIEAFEERRYWDAHELLEVPWAAATGVERAWCAGAILLCAALHKARAMGSDRGGRRNYAKALRHLALVPDRFAGTDVRELEARVHQGLRDPHAAVAWPHVPQEAP